MRTIIAAELRLLTRSWFAVVMAGVLPAAVGLMIVWAEQDTARAGWGGAAGLLLNSLVALTAYASGTTALAARRQQFVLKRLRMSGVADPAILAAMLTPVFLLTLAQAAVLMVFVAAAGHRPANPGLLVVATLGATAAGCALALATAVVTPTPEVAQLTTAPIGLAFLGGALWALQTPPGEVDRAMLAVPGVPVTQIVRSAWDGGGPAGASIVALAVLTVVVLPGAVRLFSWDPRR